MLSILIVNWNTKADLQACLVSLRNHPCDPMEVIVVDNASQDGSAEMLRTSFPEVRLIESGGNLGYAKGNNLAFGAAQGEYLLTLNPDTEVFPETLPRAVEAIKRLPEYGAIGAMQIHPTEGIQASVRGFPTWLGLLGDLTGIGRHFATLDSYRLRRFDYEEEQDAPQPMGTFLLFRRQALEAVGDPSQPFDERFPIFFNEVDLLFRLDQKGWRCRYVPTVQILHRGAASTSQVRKAMIWESHRSLIRYFEKHHPSVLLPLLRGLVWIGAMIRARGYDVGFRP